LAEELPDLRWPSGVVVVAMAADGLGVDADLQPGDVIHALNGKPIETLDNLSNGIKAIPSGAPGVLQVERDSKLMYVSFEMD
jgi:S1-C subfamily serine protease